MMVWEWIVAILVTLIWCGALLWIAKWIDKKEEAGGDRPRTNTTP